MSQGGGKTIVRAGSNAQEPGRVRVNSLYTEGQVDLPMATYHSLLSYIIFFRRVIHFLLAEESL